MPAFYENLGGMVGIGPQGEGTDVDRLKREGYQQYQATQAPDEASKFGPTDAAQIQQDKANKLQGQQLALAQQGVQQAMARQPSAAQQQLRTGADQATANAMALAASTNRGGSPGAGAANAIRAGAQGVQNAAGQSAVTAAQEQQGRNQLQQQALNAAAGQFGGASGQQLQAATQQAQLGQQANLFNAQAQQNLAALQNEQWLAANQINAQAQGQTNQILGQEALAGQQTQNQMGAGVLGGLMQAGGALLMMAKGGVVKGPQRALVGEAGPEAIVPVKREHVKELKAAQGSVAGSGAYADGAVADTSSEAKESGKSFSDRLQAASKDQTPKQQQDKSQGDQSITGAMQQGTNSLAQGIGSKLGGGKMGSATGGAGLGDISGLGAGGGANLAMLAAARGTVVDGPQHVHLGKEGPQAVIPIDEHGKADMVRVKDVGLKKLIRKHPAYRNPLHLAFGGK